MADKSLTLTAVAFALTVMDDAARAEGAAEKALEKKRGASWAAVQEAAHAFNADMSEADKTELSGQLARVYAKYYPASSAKVVASQHARAIYLLATGSPVGDARNIAAFLAAHKRTPAAGATKPETGAPEAPDLQGDEAPAAAPAQAPAPILSGVSVELGSAIARLVEAAKKMPHMEDALLYAANHPGAFISAMEALLIAKPASPAKVAQLADKHKRAA